MNEKELCTEIAIVLAAPSDIVRRVFKQTRNMPPIGPPSSPGAYWEAIRTYNAAGTIAEHRHHALEQWIRCAPTTDGLRRAFRKVHLYDPLYGLAIRKAAELILAENEHKR